MSYGRILRRRSSDEPSGDFGFSLGRHNWGKSGPNDYPLDPDERIPYVLTDLGHAEVAAFRAARHGRDDCQHPRRTYDKVDQLLACDDCGEVWEVTWQGGYPVERKPR
jgi:hypothetical protein